MKKSPEKTSIESNQCHGNHHQTQLAFTCSKLRIDALEQGVKYVHS